MYSKFESESTKELTDCAVKILDAKYKKSYLPQIVNDTCNHITVSNKLELLSLLQRYEQMSNRTLGERKPEPVNFE